MKKNYFVLKGTAVLMTLSMLFGLTTNIQAQQLPDPGFEDWSGTEFNNAIQLKYWNASNVEQVGFKFNFVSRETGRSGYAMMIQDKSVGAMGVTEEAPGYISLGQPWQYLPSITQISSASAGTYGGINFTYRPDTMVVWVKRTGDNWSKEDFHLLFYSWKGTAKSSKYKGKNGSCTSCSYTNEESDIRLALDGNECGTDTKATQIAEGWLRDRKEYTSWTKLKVPILYMNDEVPTMCNVILSAGNYPNFRANSGLYAGNSLYCDDISLIYSSKIQHLYIGGKEWKGFDPNSSEEQTYSVGRTTVVPEIYAIRGEGSLTNVRGTPVAFPGRKLTSSEMTITYGQVDGDPTVITVKSGDGTSTMTYRIKMVQEPSDNPRLADIKVNGESLSGFNGYVGTYNVALPYGTTAKPVVSYTLAEDGQVVTITQATSTSGTCTINVTAPDGKTKMTYTLNFSVALLADNTLVNILVNGDSVSGFIPTLATYRVELPLGTTTMPTVKAVSAYAAGEQTITYTAPDKIDGGQYKVSVSTPGNTTPKVYKLNFKITASSNCKLKDLQLVGYPILFNPNGLTYYVTFPMGTTEMPEITYEKGDKYQTVEIENGGVDGTTKVIVTAANGDQTIYKIICSTEKSDISYLNNIFLDGVALEGFARDTYKYTVNLPTGTPTIPTITVEQGDEYETVQITYGAVNSVTRIFVTAGDGSTSLYEITFVVQLADVVTLNMIYVGGVAIEGFSPTQAEYNIALPQGTDELPEVTWDVHDEWQTVTPRSNGVNGDYKIVVRSQAGTSMTYVLHFSVTTSANTTLSAVYFDGTRYADFDPATLTYDITLAEGVSTTPEVTFDKAESTQKTVASWSGTTFTIRVISESGASATYTFNFTIQKSANAFLNMIYLSGDSLEGFDKETLHYDVVLPEDAPTTCPTITVDKDPTQQVTITTPSGAGTAKIIVTPETGASNTYSITFTSPANANAYLSAIYADGVLIDGFAETTFDYEVAYTTAIPAISFDKEAGQQVTVVNNGNETRLVVDTYGTLVTYTLTFVQTPLTDATLKSIKANGTELENFIATTLTYTYTLPTDNTLPAITYEKQNESQQVTAGMISEWAYGMTVTAQSGAQQTYKVNFINSYSSEVSLVSLSLDGTDVLSEFDETYTIEKTIANGADLPVLTYEKEESQSVVVAKTGDNQQQVIVVAENGATRTYTINYVATSETNALLKDIRIFLNNKWSSLDGFDKNTADYNIELPWRTASAPCLWPVSDKPHQVVTITYGAANGVTTLHVVAEDGQTQDYTINFAVAKSGNTKLGSLTIDGDEQDVTVTDYTFTLPFGSTAPYDISYEKAETEQIIKYISAPVGGVTQIIVTAENGDKRTYSIRYNVAEPTGENAIKRISYSYTNKAGETVNGSLEPVRGDNPIELPFGAKSFVITGVEKKYAEQSILKYDGGIRRGAKLVALSNREGVNDVEYTVTPVMPTFDTTGKLQSLKFKDADVPNWRPDVYNYMVNVTAVPTVDDFSYTTYNGEIVTPSSIDTKKKQITFAVEGGETYSVCYYYQNDDPQFDFSKEWVAAAQGPGYKPTSAWKVPADYANTYAYNIDFIVHVNLIYQTGKEVIKAGVNGALLSTLRGAPMNGSVPGMMTTGSMSLTLKDNGNSSSSMSMSKSTGVVFRNTPEQFTLNYTPLTSNNITEWYYDILLTDGTNTKTTHYDGNYNNLNTPNSAPKTLDYTGLGDVSRMSFAINSAHTANAGDLGKGATGQSMYESQLLIQDLRFVYNSELTAATVDGNETTKDGNTFTYNADVNYLGVPSLKFTKKVHDQMQTIEWLNDGEWVDGKLTAKVTNYGENSEDNTIYHVVLQRAPVTSVNYTATFGTYTVTTGTNDTTFVNLPYGVTALPDINITPESIHQKFNVQKNGRVVEVTVTAEDGTTRHDIYQFRNVLSSDATLAGLSAVGQTIAYEPTTTDYTVTAASLPAVSFAKNTIGQQVEMTESDDKVVLLVTAEDGTTQNTYTINFTPIIETTNALLLGISRNGEDLAGFSQSTFSYNEQESENVSFSKEFAADAVVETICDDSITIALSGDASNTYKIVYPKEASQNADLKDILVNGVHYSEYQPLVTEYTYETEDPVNVEFVSAEDVQTMSINILQSASAPHNLSHAIRKASGYQVVKTIFTVTVTAENGNTKTYTFTLSPETSAVATLDMIYVNGTPLADFYPEKTKYEYVIPTTSPKTVEPSLPEITYTQGQTCERVSVAPATRLGGTAVISVTAEDGKAFKEYEITITAEPSHCADLTDILVNNESLSGFKASRTYYSTQVKGDQVLVDYSSEDRFQTVVVTNTENGKLLTVTAQDGITTKEYEVEIWTATLSNNANLKNILLDNLTLAAYGVAHDIDDMEPFSEKTYSYRIPLKGTKQLPDVSAQLQEETQSVEILTEGSTKIVRVTAEDGVTKNDYRLNFIIEKSSNTALSMIYLNGDEFTDFNSETFNYTIALQVGVEDMPSVDGIKQEAVQEVTVTPDNTAMQTIILVTAEDGTTATYTLNFVKTYSDVDILDGIYEGDNLIEGFNPNKFYYAYTLPMGIRQLPSLSYDAADKWQTVTMDTIANGMQTTYQFNVVSGSGKKNVYTVVYEIQRSDVDTLQMIFIDNKPLADFDAQKTEYTYGLPVGTTELPATYWLAGDDYQTVDTVSSGVHGSMRYIVKAENGSQRIYTVNFDVAKSSNANLAGIIINGKPLESFDEDRLTYTVKLAYGIHDVPAVTYVKAEDAQNVTLSQSDMQVMITVLAEDGVTQQTYTLTFQESLSSEAHLAMITINGEPLATFEPDLYEYSVILPYGTTQLPEVGYVLADETATAILTVEADVVTIETVSADEESMLEYAIYFSTELCGIDWLTDIRINNKTIEGFNQDSLIYNITYAKGFDRRRMATPKEITYTKADSTQTVTVGGQDGTITLQVVAENQTNVRVYVINQKILLNDNSLLRDLLLDGISLRQFEDSVFEYEYLLFEGELIPTIDAVAQDNEAEVDITLGNIGEDTYIYCTAQDGSESIYKIRFAYSDINTAQTPAKGDVLFKHIAGSDQYAAYTIRNGVTVAVYDFAGHRVALMDVPVCNPNSVQLVEDSNGQDLLYDVDAYGVGAMFTVPNTNQIYYYVFFEGKSRIASGKFMLTK